MGVLAGGGIGGEAGPLGGRRRVEVGGDRAEPAPGGVHWGLLMPLRHGDGWNGTLSRRLALRCVGRWGSRARLGLSVAMKIKRRGGSWR
jgi:hypothetical protein